MSAQMGEWTEQAACAGTPQSWWFPTTARGLDDDDIVPAEASAVCRACTVRDDCHRHALLHESHGVWAATSSADRHRLRKAAGITRLANQIKAAARRLMAIEQELWR